MIDFVRLMRRLAAHLTRSKARAGWTVVAVSLLGYFASRHLPALQQFWLVLTGVAAAAVFLPELGDDLWKLRPDQVRRTIPESHLSRLQRTLISARCVSPEWADLVWREALVPLLEAGAKPDQILWDSKYDITIHLNQQCIDSMQFNYVEGLSRARRILPDVEPRRYWVSVARTDQALFTEFGIPNCLARELVMMPGIDPSRWREIIASTCHVRMTIDGNNVPIVADASQDLLDVVRWHIDVSAEEWAGVEVPYTLQFDVPLLSTERAFPMLFDGYYNAGTTEVSLRVVGEPDRYQLDCSMFVAHGLARHPGDLVHDRNLNSQSVVFSTPKSSILWPGSGILCRW